MGEAASTLHVFGLDLAGPANAAWDWSCGAARWRWNAQPPHHPYDFAC